MEFHNLGAIHTECILKHETQIEELNQKCKV